VMWRVLNFRDRIPSRSGEVSPNFPTSIERIMWSSGDESLDIGVPLCPWRNPSGADANEAVDNSSDHHHRTPSNVKHLLITAERIRAEFPGLPSLADRFRNGAIGVVFASILSHEGVEVVIRVGENVVLFVRIAHSAGSHLSPWAIRA